MNWAELLKSEIEQAYLAAEGLMNRVDDSQLNWKPATGQNWMTTGQLLMHITNACGMCCKGFVTGDWGMPADWNPADMKPEEMMPPAEKMPTVDSVAKAKELLAQDKLTALEMLDQCGDADFSRPAPAPWDPRPTPLGQQLLSMVNHLNLHKNQLFYYLKLQGQPVNTYNLFGMA